MRSEGKDDEKQKVQERMRRVFQSSLVLFFFLPSSASYFSCFSVVVPSPLVFVSPSTPLLHCSVRSPLTTSIMTPDSSIRSAVMVTQK